MNAAQGLHELAEPWPGGSKVKEAIDRAAKAAGLAYWRAFDIWYGKARRVEEFEANLIADALQRKRELAAQNELHDLKTRLSRLESMLASTDPDFHRPSIDLVGVQIRQVGGDGGDRGGAVGASSNVRVRT